MGLEYTQEQNEPIDFDFTGTAEVPTISVQSEEVPFRLEAGAAARDEARRADRHWVSCMQMLAQIAGPNPGIMAVSDGITSHTVTAFGVVKGPEDYLVLYHDPWGPQRGSFLQRGMNVAGCAATLLEDGSGLWAIRAGELFRLLDSVLVISPKENHDGEGSDPPSEPR